MFGDGLRFNTFTDHPMLYGFRHGAGITILPGGIRGRPFTGAIIGAGLIFTIPIITGPIFTGRRVFTLFITDGEPLRGPCTETGNRVFTVNDKLNTEKIHRGEKDTTTGLQETTGNKTVLLARAGKTPL